MSNTPSDKPAEALKLNPNFKITTGQDISNRRQEKIARTIEKAEKMAGNVLKNVTTTIANVAEPFTDDIKTIFLNSVEEISKILNINLLKDYKEIYPKLEQIKKNIVNPVTREAELELLRSIKPFLNPLSKVLATQTGDLLLETTQDFIANASTEMVEALLNAIKTLPFVGEIFAAISLLSNLVNLSLSAASTGSIIATILLDTEHAVAKNIINVASDVRQKGGAARTIKQMNYLKQCKIATLHRTKKSIKKFYSPKCRKYNKI
jgi:uncharacterized protein YeeX (DUF496 family)